MKALLKSCLVLLAALTLSAFTANAQTDSTAPATPSTTNKPASSTKAKSKRYSGKITSVDESAKTITFTLPGGTTHTVHINSKTRPMKKNGEPATLADATVGEHVSGSYHVDDSGDWIATTVNIGAAKKATPPPTAPASTPDTSK